ncbi:MAG: translation initiation factor IF-2 [Patescibacteria group bacterium]
MNVTELARKLKITKKQLFDEIEELGFDVGRRAIKIDDRQAQKIYEALEGKVSLKKEAEEEEEEAVELSQGEKINLPSRIIIRDFAEKLDMTVVDLLGILMKNGIASSQNEEIDFETAAIITEDLGYDAVLAKEESTIDEEMQDDSLAKLLKDDSSRLKPKPPTVVVLGHVDHGKTALLDAIRETNVVAQESGGITQHIGAYQVEHKGKKITFIDTPGHEAFNKMRSRGAKVADIAVLVIAADDGIKPQTDEAIDIINKAKIPLLVAINKVDKPEADCQKVKQQLTQKDLNPEEWGGKIVCQEVSAKEKKGLDELLDMILLVADMEKDKLLANPKREAVGIVIESHIDKGEGAVATVVINTGTLRRGDLVSVGEIAGKIKSLNDHNGKTIKEAEPAQPVKIIGLKGCPKVGDILHVIEDQKLLKRGLKEQQKEKLRVIKEQVKIMPQKSTNKKSKITYLNLIIKADTLGSLEAIINSLRKLKTDQVAVNVVKKGLGNISGQDIIQADTTDAHLYGFHVAFTNEAQEVIRGRKYENLKTFSVIYKLIDEAKDRLEELLEHEVVREDLGKLEILAVFRKDKNSAIVGGRVIKGKILSKTKFEAFRRKEPLGEGKITQLQIQKKNVDEVKEGNEFGLRLSGFTDITEGDKLTVYQEQKLAKKLEL